MGRLGSHDCVGGLQNASERVGDLGEQMSRGDFKTIFSSKKSIMRSLTS